MPEDEVLAAIVAVADDGFCSLRDLVPRFRGYGERQIRRSLRRVERQGLVLERRGPDGGHWFALSSEAWERRRRESG